MMVIGIGLITGILFAVFVMLYLLRVLFLTHEQRIDELENQIVYLETCLFREAVAPEARHRDGAWQATEGRRP